MNDLKNLSKEAWQWLNQELDRWQRDGKCAEFWWRDDDAVEVTAELEKLTATASVHQAPLSLAVIPGLLKNDLAGFVSADAGVTVFQHGFAHVSHAQKGERKLELGGNRNPEESLKELNEGHEIMQQQFGDDFVDVLVPPWNRIADDVLSKLGMVGYRGLSVMKVRKCSHPLPGLLQVNSHLDPVNWRHGGGFIGDYPAIAILVQHLTAKRLGYRDSAEPTGLLTHHLVQNPRVWEFTGELAAFISAHPAATWCSAKSIWKD